MAAEDLSGQQFGNLKIIGDTGKRNKNGMQIVIARDDKGDIHEYLASNIKNGTATGFKRSESNSINGKKWAEQTHKLIIRNGKNVSLRKNNTATKNSKTGYKYISYNNDLKRWKVEFRFGNLKIQKNFVGFKEAVSLTNNLKEKYIYPILNDEEKEFYLSTEIQKVEYNQYILEKQKEIDLSLKVQKNTEIQNTIKRFNNSKGYSFDKARNKWAARIKINGITKHLGRFDTEQEAKAARQKAVDEQIKKLEKEMEQI